MELKGKRKPELQGICKEKGIEFQEKDTVKTLTQKIQEHTSALESADNTGEVIQEQAEILVNAGEAEVGEENHEEAPHKVKNFEAFYYGKTGRKYSAGIFKSEGLAKKALKMKGSQKTEIIPV